MAKKVKMLRQPRGQYETKPFPAVGEVAEFSDDVASTLVRFKYATEDLGEDAPEAEKPSDKRETATADKRETRSN